MYSHTSARFFVTYLGREGRRPKQNEIVRFGSVVTSDLCCHQGSWSVSLAFLSIEPFTAEKKWAKWSAKLRRFCATVNACLIGQLDILDANNHRIVENYTLNSHVVTEWAEPEILSKMSISWMNLEIIPVHHETWLKLKIYFNL